MITLILILFFLAVFAQSILFIGANLNILFGSRPGIYEAPFFVHFDYLKSFFIKADIHGAVLDTEDRPVPYALVEAHSINGQLIYRTYTNSIGDFRIPGNGKQIRLTCEKFGYKNKFEKVIDLRDKDKLITLRAEKENQIAKDPSVIKYFESSKIIWWMIIALGVIAIATSIIFNGPFMATLLVSVLELILIYFVLTFRYKITLKNSENQPIRNFPIDVFNEKNQKIASLKTDKSGNSRVLLSEGIYVFGLADVRKSIKIDRRSIINFDFII